LGSTPFTRTGSLPMVVLALLICVILTGQKFANHRKV